LTLIIIVVPTQAQNKAKLAKK